MKLYQEIAKNIDWFHRANNEWQDKAKKNLLRLVDMLPHGSGIDGITIICVDKSHANRIVIESNYHYMDEYGYYDGWLDFKVIITPDLVDGFNVRVVARFSDRHYKYSDLENYLYQTFDQGLRKEVKLE